jgi:uncharacterized protein (UPF0212 family)
VITNCCFYIYLYIGQFIEKRRYERTVAKKLLQNYQVVLSDRATNVKKRILSEDAIQDMISASKKKQNNDVIGFIEIVTTTTPAYKKGRNIYNHVICKKFSLPFFYILFIFVFSIEWRIFSSEIMQMYFKETISKITK